MRDAAGAPVEDDVAPAAYEDLAVVEVIVLDRLGETVLGQCQS